MNPQQQHCYCEGKNCNDIGDCICSGDNMTPYANKAKNAAEKSGASEIIASAFATFLTAVGAFWLL